MHSATPKILVFAIPHLFEAPDVPEKSLNDPPDTPSVNSQTGTLKSHHNKESLYHSVYRLHLEFSANE